MIYCRRCSSTTQLAVVVVCPLLLLLLRFTQAFCPSSNYVCNHAQRRRPHSRRPPIDVPSATALSSGQEKNLRAAEQERREEDRRRRERTEDVVIGRTSAQVGASDLQLDVESTEAEWLRQANPVERQVYELTERGMGMLKMFDVEGSNDAFDQVFELKSDAYLWQAGIAKYYADDWDGAADIFARCGAYYESKFGEPASEERIWRNACLLKKLTSLSRKDRKAVEENGQVESLIRQVPETDETAELVQSERRKVFKITQNLFSASITKDHVTTILARAKLLSIGGPFDDNRPRLDKKMWKISSLYYLGLHYDALGEFDESKRCMKMALKLCPNANGDDILHSLPTLHMTCRDWFDDEAFDDEDNTDEIAVTRKKKSSSKRKSGTQPSKAGKRREKPWPAEEDSNVDPIVVESLRSSLEKLRYIDLRVALKVRGLRSVGPKDELQERLFRSLLRDTDLVP